MPAAYHREKDMKLRDVLKEGSGTTKVAGATIKFKSGGNGVGYMTYDLKLVKGTWPKDENDIIENLGGNSYLGGRFMPKNWRKEKEATVKIYTN